MRDESTMLKLRWLMAIADGLCSWCFLVLSYVTTTLLLQLSDAAMDKLNRDVAIEPHLTAALRVFFPEPGYCVPLGITFLSFGYARLSFVENSQLTSRLFRWSVVVLMTLLFVASLPILDLDGFSHSSDDFSWLDEAAFVTVSFVILIFCLCCTRRYP